MGYIADLSDENKEVVRQVLAERFPELETGEDLPGADTVDALGDLFQRVGGVLGEPAGIDDGDDD